ncbi:dextranase, partial [Salmonella enterica subsp. enterica serovar Kentucky]|nr:dextranase [Salmonella enterica subsp. enterica serovar Kentucky]ECA4420773.1 dextranase [Salmonella enterica subsp. enterica serovar Kentucky]ECS9834029.1 dextranase [Salmonella enterica subsp. enterica serovar Kentucky]ECU3979841.1 dextranase [Salmonella enterica subsp. enterica serovar Kentucky]
MPGGFVATGTKATDITVFNQGFGLLTGGIVGMQDATIPGRLTVQVAVNGTEHPV